MKKHRPFSPKRNRRRLDKKPLLRRLVLFLGALCVVGGLIWGGNYLLENLEFFKLKKIEVVGELRRFQKEEILEKARVPLGANLFKLSLTEISQGLEVLDFIQEVHIRRRLPSTLVLEVKEHQPTLLLYTGHYYYINEKGELFFELKSPQENKDYPVLRGFAEKDLLNRPLWVKKHLKKASQLYQAYQSLEQAKSWGLSEIRLDPVQGFQVFPEKAKYNIAFGWEKFHKKVSKLSQVLKKIQEDSLKVSKIDLNYPGKVLVRH